MINNPVKIKRDLSINCCTSAQASDFGSGITSNLNLPIRFLNILIGIETESNLKKCFPETVDLQDVYLASGNISEICCACLLPLDDSGQQLVTSISCCYHVYHLNCILKWCETDNTCCMCKYVFNYIGVYTLNGKLERRSLITNPQKPVEYSQDGTLCGICCRIGDQASIIKCHLCEYKVHWYCANLDACPIDWNCSIHSHLQDTVTLTNTLRLFASIKLNDDSINFLHRTFNETKNSQAPNLQRSASSKRTRRSTATHEGAYEVISAHPTHLSRLYESVYDVAPHIFAHTLPSDEKGTVVELCCEDLLPLVLGNQRFVETGNQLSNGVRQAYIKYYKHKLLSIASKVLKNKAKKIDLSEIYLMPRIISSVINNEQNLAN